jgi:hypothetical protein
LVVDFDDTCTEKDTISVLLNAVVEANASAAAAAASASNAAEAAQHRRQELSAMMKTLSGNYLQKQQLLLDSLLPSDSTPAAAAGPAAAAAAVYDEQGLRGFCESLSDFDVAMNQIVFDAGALKGKVGGRKTAYHCTRRGVWREGEAPGGGGGGEGEGITPW